MPAGAALAGPAVLDEDERLIILAQGAPAWHEMPAGMTLPDLTAFMY